MFFTREDILKIQNALLQLSVKDSELPSAEPVTYDNTLSIVQDGKNKQIKIKEFLKQISLWKREDFINISDKYDEHYISLIEAINLVPILQRKDGLVITFQNIEGNWEIYQFRGNITEFFNIEKWFNLYDYRNNIIQSIVPDEEDLTASTPDKKGNSLVSLKDRVYDPTNFSGKGYKILRKNIQSVNIASTKINITKAPSSDGTLSFTINGKETQVAVSASTDSTTALVAQKVVSAFQESMTEYKVSVDASLITLTRKFSGLITSSVFSASTTGVVCTILDSTKRELRNILTPAMINQPNTIYEIRYDFDLDGKTVEIKENCILKFEGGSLSNGIISGENVEIQNINNSYIFKENLIYNGGFIFEALDIRWFGALPDLKDPNNNGTECYGTDCSFAIQKAVEWSEKHYGIFLKIVGAYYLANTITVIDSLNIKGYSNSSLPLLSGVNSNPLISKSSTIYVKPGITAFKLLGNKRIDHNGQFASIDIENVKFLTEYGFNDNWEKVGHTVLVKSNLKGAPARPFMFINNVVRDFYTVFDLSNEFDSSNQSNWFDITIRNNQISRCGTVCDFSISKLPSGPSVLTNGCINIVDNIIEQNQKPFKITTCSYLGIINNLLENNGECIITASRQGTIEIKGNYFELQNGDFIINGYYAHTRLFLDANSYNGIGNKYHFVINKCKIEYLRNTNDSIRINDRVEDVSPNVLFDSDIINSTKDIIALPISKSNIQLYNTPENEFVSFSSIFSGNEIEIDNFRKYITVPSTDTDRTYVSINYNNEDIISVSFYKTEGSFILKMLGGRQQELRTGASTINLPWAAGFFTCLVKVNNYEVDYPRICIMVGNPANIEGGVHLSNLLIANVSKAPNFNICSFKDHSTSWKYSYGSYAEKPTNINIGFNYYNTDTHKTITWDGSKWWNPDGTEATS